MSDPCIRGCQRPCPCPDCVTADHPQHGPQPAPAEEGLLCKRDANRLHRWLGDVLDDTARLDARIPTDYRLDKEGGHHKVSGSPALVRLDVAALTDHRSSSIVGAFTRLYPENQDQRPAIDIPGEVMSWARMFTEERELTAPVDNMARAVQVLTTWFDAIVTLPWVDEFYRVMHDIRQLLDLAHNVERPKPMGQCFTCDAALYSRPGCTDIRCGTCGRRYDGMDVVKLEVQRRREASA